MPGLDLDDVIERKRDEEQAAPARRSLELDDVIAPKPEEAAPAPAHESGTGMDWLDSLLGLEEGATLGKFRALAGPAGLGSRGVGRLFDEHEANTARALETPIGQVSKGAGTAATALGLGALAGPGVAAQAATGAGVSAIESDGDWMATLLGGAAGGAGGAAGKYVQGLSEPGKMLPSMALGAGAGALLSDNPWTGAAKGAAGAAALRGGAMLAPQAVGTLAAGARGAGQLAAVGAGAARADAPDVAYGTAPTMAWAAQSVLASGDSGLTPEDEQRLTEAMLDGDEDKVISANFALQMKNPGYSARLQRELESLQEE